MLQPLTICLIFSPTAMGLGELSGFDNDVRDALAIQRVSEKGAFPAEKMFTTEVNALKSPPFSMLVTLSISLRCLGLKPEVPPAKPGLNFLITARTSSVLKGFTGEWRQEGLKTAASMLGVHWGCFSFKASKVLQQLGRTTKEDRAGGHGIDPPGCRSVHPLWGLEGSVGPPLVVFPQ